jgi:hypothetical protein
MTSATEHVPGGRPRVAVICTVFFPASHADVIVPRLSDGYELHGQHTDSRVDIASIYLEQLGVSQPAPQPDIGVEFIRTRGIPRFSTVAEAIGCGRPGVNVDGVVIIGEHGDYPLNEYGQKLYPRRRLFDAAVSTMISAGRTVPIFNDKGLSWSAEDATYMVDTAHRLGIPLLAGSSVPLAWRVPTASEWPLGAPMDHAVLAGYGPIEVYGFHNLEALQVHVERRRGGETGVAAIEALAGERARQAVADGRVDPALLRRALQTFDLSDADLRRAAGSIRELTLLEYRDGLRAAVVNCADVIRNFAIACSGPADEMACQMWLQGPPHHGHFTFLVRQIEALVLNQAAPYPVQRTQLTTGILDVAMRGWHAGGARYDTPELAISYPPPAHVSDTGVPMPRPTQ